MPGAQRGNSEIRCATAAMVLPLADVVPSFQATTAATERAPVSHTDRVVQLGDEVHDPAIDRIALTGQLRQLLKHPLKTLNEASAQRSRT